MGTLTRSTFEITKCGQSTKNARRNLTLVGTSAAYDDGVCKGETIIYRTGDRRHFIGNAVAKHVVARIVGVSCHAFRVAFCGGCVYQNHGAVRSFREGDLCHQQ